MRLGYRDERGIALMVSLIGIIVVGALVTGVFASGYVEQRTGENTRWMERAFGVAEYGVSETIAQWNIGTFNRLTPGQSANVAGAVPGGTGTYAGTVRRLNQELFLVDLVGRDARGSARQRLGAFIKLRPLFVDVQAALTTRGTTRVGGSARINGTDQTPVGWTGCDVPPDPMLPGIRIPENDDVQYAGGCAGGSCIIGDPRVDEDVSVNDDTFFDYGELDWAGLTQMATKPLPPGTYTGIDPRLVGGQCNTASTLNWGAPLDPLSPCHNYFPIVYVPGNMSINGNTGQGMLLVEGDLNVQGGFKFYGIVIVRGRLRTTGTGGHFNGGVLSANVDLDQSSLLGDAIVNFSSCAVARALSNGSPGAQLRSRGWMQVY